MRHAAAVSLGIAAILGSFTPSLAIVNGIPDGNAHPAIGIIIGTDPDADNCVGFNQWIGFCGAVLIAPDTILTASSCAQTWQGGLDQGLVDELWVIFAENPFDATGHNFDCTKFRDIDETQIISHPTPPPIMGIMKLASPVLDIVPAALPTEDRLQTVARGVDHLTIVSMSQEPGQSVLSLRRRSGQARTIPPLTQEFHPLELTSPAGASFGQWIDGGATFVGDTNEIVSLGVNTGVPTYFPRLDTPAARAFLSQFVTVP